MSQELIRVYLMPGMAASPKIFEHIKLPENQFKNLLFRMDNSVRKRIVKQLCFTAFKKY